MIVFTHKGNFKNTTNFFEKAPKIQIRRILEAYGKEGVLALANATPVDSGKTASSWGYEISISKNSYKLSWTNSNIQNGVPIAILLQYGHGTRNGGYVEGLDYINPTLQPIFDKISKEAWKEIQSI